MSQHLLSSASTATCLACRVGRILVRKLLLRGYPVTALVKPDSPGLASIPKAVRIVKGDLGEYKDLREAMAGIDKVQHRLAC